MGEPDEQPAQPPEPPTPYLSYSIDLGALSASALRALFGGRGLVDRFRRGVESHGDTYYQFSRLRQSEGRCCAVEARDAVMVAVHSDAHLARRQLPAGFVRICALDEHGGALADTTIDVETAKQIVNDLGQAIAIAERQAAVFAAAEG